MRDGRTHRTQPAPAPGKKGFLKQYKVSLVVVSGEHAGHVYALDRARLVLGRGTEVAISVADKGLSRQHAAFEIQDAGVRVVDLASTNGVFVNDERVEAVRLNHGDRITLGGHKYKYVVEEIEKKPQVFVIGE